MNRKTVVPARLALTLSAASIVALATLAPAVTIPFQRTNPNIEGFAYGPGDIETADFDKDGRPDIVLVNSNSNTLGAYSVAWYHNQGGSPPSYQRTILALQSEGIQIVNQVEAADFNDDGWVDFITISDFNSELMMYQNDGVVPVTFTRRSLITSVDTPGYSLDWSRDMQAIDLDNDGDLDLVVVSAIDDKLQWFENDGTANPDFTHHVIASASVNSANRPDFPISVAAGDLNGDGFPEIVCSSNSTQTVQLWTSSGTNPPTFTKSDLHVHPTTSNFEGIRIGDLDGDGFDDIVVINALVDEIAYYRNNGDTPRTFTRHVIVSPTVTPSYIADVVNALELVDVDGDGNLDLFVAHADVVFGGFQPFVYEVETQGGFSTAVNRYKLTGSNSIPDLFAFADYDLDGDLDVAVSGLTSGIIEYLQNVKDPIVLGSIELTESGNPGNTTDPLEVQGGTIDVELIGITGAPVTSVELSLDGQFFSSDQTVEYTGQASIPYLLPINPPDGVYTITAQILNVYETSAPVTAEFVVDILQPTIPPGNELTREGPSQIPDLPFSCSVGFSEAIQTFDGSVFTDGLTPDAVSLAGSTVDTSGAIITVTEDPNKSGDFNYIITISGTVTGEGTLVVSLVPGSVVDTAGNPVDVSLQSASVVLSQGPLSAEGWNLYQN